MRKQPLPRSQLQQAILRCIIISSASLVISVNTSMAQPPDIAFVNEPETCDFVYGVNDDKLSDSQFFRMDPSDNYAITPLGDTYWGYDLEALDVSVSGEIYVAAGDNTDDVSKAGYLYKFDPEIPNLIEVCPTGFAEVDGLSFNPMTGELYGWAQDAGLIKIAIPDVIPGEECATLIYESEGEVEDVTWSNDGTTLYVVRNDHAPYPGHPYIYTNDEATSFLEPGYDGSVSQQLIAYNVVGGVVTADPICSKVIDSLGEIEAIEMDIVGNLLLGYHRSNNKPMIATLDPEDCDISTQPPPPYPSNMPFIDNDIEAMGVCPCIPTDESGEWEYVKDPKYDATGSRNLEIRGIAMKITGDNKMWVAVNSNLARDGWAVPPGMKKRIPDGFVSYSDFAMFFANGTHYAAKFAERTENDSVLKGLYKKPSLLDVTRFNLGFSRLSEYIAVLGEEGINVAMGDMGVADMLTYLPANRRRSLKMSIEWGDPSPNGDYEDVGPEQLEAEGLNFADALGADHLGTYTFGFKFNKQMDMKGYFIATLYTECSNDGIAIIGELPDCPPDGSEDLEED